ncbi:hypothetical protein BH23DEI1_BH23DEI1_19940 [soil metagenome]|nr:hypothetical protein [Trueperaceae bacterium]
MPTWLLSADGQLLNLDNVEYLDVLDVFAEDAPAEEVAAGELEPAYSELVGFLASGHEIVLFDDEDAEVVMHAFDLLKTYLTSPSFEAVHAGTVVSVQDLVDRASAKKN